MFGIDLYPRNPELSGLLSVHLVCLAYLYGSHHVPTREKSNIHDAPAREPILNTGVIDPFGQRLLEQGRMLAFSHVLHRHVAAFPP